MMIIALSFLLAALLALYLHYRFSTKEVLEITASIPGPKPIPILGNLLQMGCNSKEYWYVTDRIALTYGDIFKIQMGTKLYVLIWNPKYIEVLLSSTKEIEKGFGYNFLTPWLGYGLLTSKGQRWHSHRKFLTPAFHFKILEQFVGVFNNNGKILLENLSKHVNGPEFEITQYIELCTLDNIAETAMGVTLNCQRGGSMEYVHAVRSMGHLAYDRIARPWLYPDFIFSLSPQRRQQERNLSVLHGLTKSIIKIKKEEIQNSKLKNYEGNADSQFGIKKRQAFLDLMLRPSEEGVRLTDEEIREEVDTFMFEGHDTTSAAISFTLWCLSKHPDIQENVLAEMERIFGDSVRSATFHDLQDMKYLEMVIKETLRLYPSVPLYGRQLTETMTFGDHTVPAGTGIVVLPYLLMRRADIYPDPEKFDPDRFLPENCISRDPFSYVPFSAGPRNCIGQKFAMLEIKSTVSEVMRKFKILESDSKEELRYIIDFVLKPLTPLKLKLIDRKDSTLSSTN